MAENFKVTTNTFYSSDSGGGQTTYNQQFNIGQLNKKIIGYGIQHMNPIAAGNKTCTLDTELSLNGTTLTLSIVKTSGDGSFRLYDGAVAIVVYYVDA
jgi:hypothetical protein